MTAGFRVLSPTNKQRLDRENGEQREIHGARQGVPASDVLTDHRAASQQYDDQVGDEQQLCGSVGIQWSTLPTFENGATDVGAPEIVRAPAGGIECLRESRVPSHDADPRRMLCWLPRRTGAVRLLVR